METPEDFVDQSERLFAEGRTAEARALLEEHLGRMPSDWQWLVDHGEEREIAFWDDEELRAYSAFFASRLGTGLRVTWVGPAYTKAIRLAADVALAEGRLDDAVAQLERAVALEPDQPKLLLPLSKLRENAGRREEALALAERAATARAWAPPEETSRARDAATRLRVRLSAPSTAPAPQVRRSVPPPKLGMLGATDAPREGLGRVRGVFESSGAKAVAIVACLTALLLLVVGALTLFKTPPNEARVRAFGTQPATYARLAEVAPAPSIPFRRGKVVIVDVGARSLDPLTHLVDPDLRADEPSEVGTVVLVKWSTLTYDNIRTRDGQLLARAAIPSADVTVVDLPSKLAVTRKLFTGDEPNDKLRLGDQVLKFVQALPAVGKDAPSVEVVGSTSGAGRPVDPSELYDIDFTVATVASRVGRAGRSSGKGRAFRETLPGGVSFEMVDVPAATFAMGVPTTDGNEQDFGMPRHDVAVPSFFVGRTEVSSELWRAVAALPKVNRDLDPNPSHLDGAGLPASAICFADANEFCLRLARATGRSYRLPSEAEWEYAALGGTNGPFPTGASVDPLVANVAVDPNDPASPRGPKRTGPTPVASFGVSNRFGLFDVDGNLSEWCLDAFHSSYLDAPRDGSAWVAGSTNMRRVARGGSYATLWTAANARKRFGFEPTVRYGYFGLRLALSKG